MAVTISGEYQGLWHDFDSGEKGNILNLIQTKLNLNFKDALEYASKLVNFVPNYAIKQEIEKLYKDKSIQIQSFTEDEKRRINYAKKLADESKDIKGTLAEKYLKDTRGINLQNWPKDISYHEGIYSKLNDSKNPALIIKARDKYNNIQAVQAIYLNEKGEKADVSVQKQTFGVIKGAVFSANNLNIKSKTAVISEGMEDALSILKADKANHVFACLGRSNFNNLPKETFQKYEKIIFALDNDGKNIKDMPNALNSASRLEQSNNNIFITQPVTIKQDYNDLLNYSKMGEKEIKNLINQAVNYKDIKGSMLNTSSIDLGISKNNSKILNNESQKNKNTDLKIHKNIEKEI